MMKKSTLILALLAAALVALYLAVALDTDPGKTGVLFTPRAGETISEIEVKNAYGTFDFYQRDGEWLVSDGNGEYYTNADKMNLLTSALGHFTVLRVLEQEDAAYGLATPQAAVSYRTSAGRSETVIVGNVCANAAEHYVRADSAQGVLITDSASVAQLTGSLAAYRTKQVFQVDLNSIVEIRYQRSGQEPVTVVRGSGDSWRLTAPFEAGARRLELSEFLAKLTTWSIAGYPEAAGVGAEAEIETLTLTDTAGNTQSLTLGRTEGTARYARLGETDDLVALYAADIDLSVLEADALVYEAPLYVAMDQVREFSIRLADATYDFTIDAQTQTAQMNGRYIDYDALVGIYYRYVLLLADGWDAAATPGEPVAVFHSALTDGATRDLVLRERDDATLFMEYGGATRFYLETDRVALLLERLAALR